MFEYTILVVVEGSLEIKCSFFAQYSKSLVVVYVPINLRATQLSPDAVDDTPTELHLSSLLFFSTRSLQLLVVVVVVVCDEELVMARKQSARDRDVYSRQTTRTKTRSNKPKVSKEELKIQGHERLQTHVHTELSERASERGLRATVRESTCH